MACETHRRSIRLGSTLISSCISLALSLTCSGCNGAKELGQGQNRDVTVLEDWYVSQSDTAMPKGHFVARVHRLYHWQDGAYSLCPDEPMNRGVPENSPLGEWQVLLHGKVGGSVTAEAGDSQDLDLGGHGRADRYWVSAARNNGVLGGTRCLPAAFLDRPRVPEFGWWVADEAKQPVVLVSHVTNRCERESWHSDMEEEPAPENVQGSFCQNVVAYICDEKDASSGKGERTRISLSIDWVRNNVDIVQHLRSSRGDELCALRFRKTADACDNWFGHYDAQHWFYSSARDAKVQYLGSEIALVDYGDFNCDGRTEFLFRVKKYNEDGYRMFWDRFNGSLDYTWRYH